MRTGNFVSRALVRVRQQKIYEDGTINPKTGKTYAKPQSHSFLYDHQVEDHNGVPPEFKLQSKRYYGKDRLACQVAEGVSIKMRTGNPELKNRLGRSFTHHDRKKHSQGVMTMA